MKDVDLSGWSWKPFELLEEDRKWVFVDGGEDMGKVHFEDGGAICGAWVLTMRRKQNV